MSFIEYIGAAGSVATAIAVGVAGLQYLQSQKKSRLQHEREISIRIRENLDDFVRTIGNLTRLMRDGAPLILGGALIAKQICERSGQNPTPETIFEQLGNMPSIKDTSQFALLSSLEGWKSSPETKRIDEMLNHLNNIIISLSEIKSVRILVIVADLFEGIVKDGYSPTPLFTRILSKEIISKFIEKNKNEKDVMLLENNLASFLYGNASLYFKMHYYETVKHLDIFSHTLKNILLEWDDSKIFQTTKENITNTVGDTKTDRMKEIVNRMEISQNNKNSLLKIIDDIQESIAKPEI